MRWFLRTALAIAAVALIALPSSALMIAMKAPAQRAITADMVVVGKVTAIEKDSVEVLPFPGSPNKVAYKVAVVKIENGLAGAANTTHVKIGFIPHPKVDPNAPPPPVGGIRPPIRRGPIAPELKEGQEMLFFLSKHPSGEFYVMPSMSPPVDVTNDQGKKDLESVKKIATVMADPMKGLKSDKADVRAETAAIMVLKYRAYPDFAAETDQVAIPADESKLILKGLAEGDWSNNVRPVATTSPNAMQAFYQLGLTDKDGWKQPMFPQPKPGQPAVDFNAIMKDAYIKWLDGQGKDYVIKKVVAKKASDK